MKKFNKVLSVVVASAMVMAMVPLQPVLTQQLRAQQLTTVQHPAVYSKLAVSDLPPVAQQFTDWLYSMVQRSQ